MGSDHADHFRMCHRVKGRLKVRSRRLKGRPAGETAVRVREIIGRGVKARIGNGGYTVGNERLIREEGIDISGLETEAAQLPEARLSKVFVAGNVELLGLIGLRYDLKQGAARTIGKLRREGVTEMLLLSGDARAVAARTAGELKLDGDKGGLLPEDKAEWVARLEGLAGSLPLRCPVTQCPGIARFE